LDSKKLNNTLETYTNVAVLLVALAALSTFALNHFVKAPPPSIRAGLERGVRFGAIRSLDYRNNKQTLLIALNTNCSYCRDSLPFYRKLALANDLSEKKLRIVALFPNKSEEVERYIKENDFRLDTISDVEFSSLKISGTPSMILVDNNGAVNDFWIGKLPDAGADQLIGFLTSKNTINSD